MAFMRSPVRSRPGPYPSLRSVYWTQGQCDRGRAAASDDHDMLAHSSRTGTKDPNASDVLYIKALAPPFTVNMIPEATLNALADHSELSGLLPADGGTSKEVLAQFAAPAWICRPSPYGCRLTAAG